MDLNELVFILITILQILSFFTVIHIFLRYTHRTSPLRRLQNHLLMCLLIVATWTITLELPSTQKYLWSGSATIYTSWFCSLWNASFFSTTGLNRILMAFMSIERHFLVFRPQIYRTRRSRLLFHYIPLIFTISLTLIYVFVTSIFISCPQMYFNYSRFMCGYTCLVLMKNLGAIYIWVSVFISTIITIIGCVLLPIRFVIQKRNLQHLQWHRARKMIMQTSMIASVYTICWFPYTVILQLVSANIISYSQPDVNRFVTIVPYMTSVLTPFIVYHTIRRPMNLRIIQRLKHRFFPQRQGIVQPVSHFIVRQHNPSTDKQHTATKRMKIGKISPSHSLNIQ